MNVLNIPEKTNIFIQNIQLAQQESTILLRSTGTVRYVEYKHFWR